MTATVDFRMIDRSSHFLDPRCNFQPFVDKIHVRFDPLTGRSCHFSHAGAVKLQKVNPKIYERPEIKGFCPFCKDGREDRVPQYPDELFPGGRLTRGEAFLFPDLYPYDQFNAVTVMTDDHVVPLEDFTERRLLDSFSVGIEFLKQVGAMHPHAPHHVMTWNYMPPSGADFVHPHQLYLATENPGNLYMDEYRAAELFFKEHGSNFWQELVLQETETDKRYIGRVGDSHWMASFTSLGVLGEIAGVFPELFSVEDFMDHHIADMVAAIRNVFRYFIDKGIGSFNAGLFFGQAGQEFFSAHVRILPRTFSNTRDYSGDFNSFQVVLTEPVCVVLPENLCAEAKRFF